MLKDKIKKKIKQGTKTITQVNRINPPCPHLGHETEITI